MSRESSLGAKNGSAVARKGPELAHADESNDYITSQILYNLQIIGNKRDHCPKRSI